MGYSTGTLRVLYGYPTGTLQVLTGYSRGTPLAVHAPAKRKPDQCHREAAGADLPCARLRLRRRERGVGQADPLMQCEYYYDKIYIYIQYRPRAHSCPALCTGESALAEPYMSYIHVCIYTYVYVYIYIYTHTCPALCAGESTLAEPARSRRTTTVSPGHGP